MNDDRMVVDVGMSETWLRRQDLEIAAARRRRELSSSASPVEGQDKADAPDLAERTTSGANPSEASP